MYQLLKARVTQENEITPSIMKIVAFLENNRKIIQMKSYL